MTKRRDRRRQNGATTRRPCYVFMDPVLLTMLREAGLHDGLIAEHARDILRGDGRVERHLDGIIGGLASKDRGVAIATVPLAHGVHWVGCGIRIVGRHAGLPDTIRLTLKGRPLDDVVVHPLLPRCLKIIGVKTGDVGIKGETIDCLTIRTDAQCIMLRRRPIDMIKQPFRRLYLDGNLPECKDGPDGTQTMIFIAIVWLMSMGATWGMMSIRSGGVMEEVLKTISLTGVWLIIAIVTKEAFSCERSKDEGVSEDLHLLGRRMRLKGQGYWD